MSEEGRVCPLCLVNHSSAEELWRSYHHNGAAAALAAARQIDELQGAPISGDDLRAHFTSHQAPMADIGRSSQKERDLKIKGMRERKRRILALSWRWGPLSSELIRELFFSHQSLKSGKKNSMLRMYELAVDDLLFRVYPDQLPGAVLGERPEPPLYYCSPMSGSLIQQRYGRLPRSDETLRSLRSAPRRSVVSKQIAQTATLQKIVSSLGDRVGEGVRELKISDDESLTMNAEKIFGMGMSEFKFKDPIGGRSRIRPSGIFWLDYRDGEKISTIPFCLYRDDPSIPIEKIISEFGAWQALLRSGEFRSRFPAIPPDSPPILVFSCDLDDRLSRISRIRRPQGSLQLPALAIESRHLSNESVWTRELWAPVFSDSPRQSSRVSIIDLIRAASEVFPSSDPLPWKWRDASFPLAEWIAHELEREQNIARSHQIRQSMRSAEQAAKVESERSPEQKAAAEIARELEEEEL